MFEADDIKRLGIELRKLFPDLKTVTPLRVLGSGFNSTALETAEGLVFRIAKNEWAAAGYRKEARFLPVMAAQLPTPIPDPQWYAATSGTFPFGVIGYRKLAGTPMTNNVSNLNQDTLAGSIAQFLMALHGIPLDVVEGMKRSEVADYTALRESVMPTLRTTLTSGEYATIATWWERFLVDVNVTAYQPVVCHGDLWYENMLVDDTAQQVTGVLDFENMTISDPALDFVALLYLGEAFVAQVIRAYEKAGGMLGGDFLRRLNWLWGLREFGGVAYSVRFDDAEELADSIEKIRKGPILTPREFRI
ncbi:MAG: phosphotransferase [Anaerolineae bacterium]|nr:phosphotransferase [Anaerolineae bacterium]